MGRYTTRLHRPGVFGETHHFPARVVSVPAVLGRLVKAFEDVIPNYSKR